MATLTKNTATIETPNGITLNTKGTYVPYNIVVKPRTDTISATDGSGTLTLNNITAVSQNNSISFFDNSSGYPTISLSTSASTAGVNVKTTNSNGGWVDFSGENNSHRVCNASSANKNMTLHIYGLKVLSKNINIEKSGLYMGIAYTDGMLINYDNSLAGDDFWVQSKVLSSLNSNNEIWYTQLYMKNIDFKARIHSSDFSSATVSLSHGSDSADITCDSSGAFVFTY